MPELPEVQTTVNGIDKNLRGLVIRDVWTSYGGIIHQQKTHIKSKKYFIKFKKEVIGKKILGASRRGKNVLIHLTHDKTILVHMKMTGHLLYGKYTQTTFVTQNLNRQGKKMVEKWVAVNNGPLKDDSFNQFIRLVFTLQNGKHLALSDMRKFAKVTLLKTGELESAPELIHLGPEPLEKTFTTKVLKERLSKRLNGKIKQVLMDQTIVAGIGNIYSDEILWASGIHPLRQVKKLSQEDFQNIFSYIKIILKKGIDFKGDSMSDYRNIDGNPGKFQTKHNVYRKTGKACSKKNCHGTIQRIIVGGRSAHFCSDHQI